MREQIRFQPASSLADALRHAAEIYGLETSYVDNWGQTHEAAGEVQQGILQALGLDATTLEALNAAEEERLWRSWNQLLPPTKVTGQKPGAGELSLHLPAKWLHHRVEVVLRLEDGQLERGDFAGASMPTLAEAFLRGEHFVQLQIPIYSELPLGYHQLSVQVGEMSARMTLIVGPEKAWRPDNLRTVGMAISVYGLTSGRNWGVGDTTDLLNFGEWAQRELGVSFLGLNPLHAIHNRLPFNTSPYLPVSAYFRNPLYIDVESAPEYTASQWAQRLVSSEKFQRRLAELRQPEFVEYEGVWKLKKTVLRLLYRALERQNSERRKAFDAYCEEAGAERRRAFATFCALDEAIHREQPQVWLYTDWPAEYQDPQSEKVADFREKHRRSIRFYLYLQWVLEEQLARVQEALKAAGMMLGLYHDLALASDRFGFDVWYERKAFADGVRVGSPPDGFSPEGQDWAFPPPSRTYALENHYASFTDLIRANAKSGGALRFDHVMRFFRLYWIPAQLTARQGSYVANEARDLLRIIALESQRGKFLVIGEDLGTVTPMMRELLDQFGILGYRLLIFERDGAAFRPPEQYPELAAASVTTHDLPTLTGFLSGADIEARKAAGLLPDETSYERQWAERRESLEPLYEALHLEEVAEKVEPEELVRRVFHFLSSAKSAVFIINQEEITGEEHQQNLPGSTAEYPNWRRKMRVPIEELSKLRSMTEWMRDELRATGR